MKDNDSDKKFSLIMQIAKTAVVNNANLDTKVIFLSLVILVLSCRTLRVCL